MSCRDEAYVYFSELTQKWNFDCEPCDESIGFTFEHHARKALQAHIWLQEALTQNVNMDGALR